jgi:hypothetical protein
MVTRNLQNHMRQVSTAEGGAYAARMGCLFVESSAKTAVGVREAFRGVVERVLLSISDSSESRFRSSGPSKPTHSPNQAKQ